MWLVDVRVGEFDRADFDAERHFMMSRVVCPLLVLTAIWTARVYSNEDVIG